MTYDPQSFEETGDELRDDEFPDDEDDDGRGHTVPCPHCGAEIYEDAVQCPACGTYVTHDTSVFSGRSAWWIVLALLGIAAVILVLAGLPAW